MTGVITQDQTGQDTRQPVRQPNRQARRRARKTGPNVVVIGGGFAGLTAVQELAGCKARVTVVDRNVYSTFQPLLYQVATAGLTSADVAYPLWTMAGRTGASFRKGELVDLDLTGQYAVLGDGTALPYDYLIIATGVGAGYFGVTGAEENSLCLYTRSDAVELRNKLLHEFEQRNQGEAGTPLDITVVGGGATGVELAGTLAELRNIALPSTFPELRTEGMNVRLIEMSDVVLAPYKPRQRTYARKQLEKRGVDVMLNTKIAEVAPDSVLLADGRRLRSDITIWAAGVAAPDAPWDAGLARGKGGRIDVDDDLRVAGQDRVFCIGDVALSESRPLPQLAQPAIQQGKHAGRQVARMIKGQQPEPFRYQDRGTMATIGRLSAVVELPGGLRLRGTSAWAAWLVLHLMFLLGNRNRLATLVNLTWRYLTWSRGGGVIIGDDDVPAD